MDFMISQGFEPGDERLRSALAEKSIDEGTRFSETVLGGTRVFHSQPLIRDSGTGGCHCFDGSVVSRSVYVSYFKRPTEQDILEIVGATSGLAGVFALVSITPDGDVVTTLDELSQYLLFYYSDESGRHVIANNPYFIETYLEANGLEVERSLDGFVASMLWSSAMWGGGGYKNIATIGHNETLSFRGGRFERSRRPEARPLDYDDAIEMTASTLRRGLRTLASNPQDADIYYDVTGGKDSRMVFAALQSEGLHKEFACNTLFRYPHPDGHYASFLAEKYGLRAHQFRKYGFDDSGPRSMRVLDESHHPQYEVFTSFGLNSRMAVVGRFQEPDVMRIGGGHGELGGGSPDVKRSRANKGTAESGPAELAENYIKSIGYLGFADYLTPTIREAIGDRTKDLFSRLERDLFTGNEASQLLYNQGRNRTHFTLISYMRNRMMNYPDILCTRSLQDAGRWLSVDEKAAGKANFDVVHALGGDEAVSIPMAEETWSDLADPKRLGGRDYIAGPLPKRFSEPFQVSHPESRTRFEVDPDLAELSRGERAIVYHQREISQALSEGNPIVDVFDATELASLAKAETGELLGKHLRILETAATGAIWMRKSEIPNTIASCPAPPRA